MYTIYGLCEPFRPDYSHERCPSPEYNCWWWRYSLYRRIRYIGVTDDMYRRFGEHLLCRDKSNPKKNDWVRTYRDRQHMIQMETLQQVDTLEIALIRETYWIAYYHYLGSNLFNQQKYQWLPSRERIQYVIDRHISSLQDPHLQRTWHIWSHVHNDEERYVLHLKPDEQKRRCLVAEKALARRVSTQSWEELVEHSIR